MSLLLRISNVTKTYGKGKNIKHALQGVSFDINRGETLALLGANGAGKTTLSSIIATLHPASSGDIIFDGNSLYKDVPAYRRQMGFCAQSSYVNTHFSIQEELEFVGRYYGVAHEVVVERIATLANQLGFTAYLSKKAGELSGGYKQRFLIARSLIHNPTLLILDEPTVALDPHIRQQLWTVIKNLKEHGVTILLTTHYLDEAEELADRVVILHEGTIRLIDTPDNLKATFHKGRLEDVFLQLMKDMNQE